MHQPRKRFGQNFLTDQGIIHQILDLVAAQADETIIEIGPGQAALTEPLMRQAGRLIVVEIDRDLVSLLHKRIPDLEVVNADALKVDFSQFPAPFRLVGNLPYNISTPLIFHLLKFRDSITDMHFMLQKEVVDRMAAEPGSKAYGRLSITTQYSCSVRPLLHVPPESFDPAPKVDSAVVALRPRPPEHPVQDFARFDALIKAAFSKRRKTLRNALKGTATATQLEQAGIDPGQRAETVSIAQYVALCNQLAET